MCVCVCVWMGGEEGGSYTGTSPCTVSHLGVHQTPRWRMLVRKILSPRPSVSFAVYGFTDIGHEMAEWVWFVWILHPPGQAGFLHVYHDWKWKWLHIKLTPCTTSLLRVHQTLWWRIVMKWRNYTIATLYSLGGKAETQNTHCVEPLQSAAVPAA